MSTGHPVKTLYYSLHALQKTLSLSQSHEKKERLPMERRRGDPKGGLFSLFLNKNRISKTVENLFSTLFSQLVSSRAKASRHTSEEEVYYKRQTDKSRVLGSITCKMCCRPQSQLLLWLVPLCATFAQKMVVCNVARKIVNSLLHTKMCSTSS